MAKRRVVKSEAGVVLSEAILFGGNPRKRIGTRYEVTTPRRPDPRLFDSVDEAAKFFHVQVSLAGSRRLGSRRETA